ncbi:MAG: ABC transporter permease [Candidatus Eisenbacteria bacterium]|nr:ABC transporter permease [Candidatus Eisenbacteria bacterium]
MNPSDLFGLTFEALSAHRLRYSLTALAIAVGVAAVVLLASIGEGTRRYIVGQFSQFGTTIILITPGKTETAGIGGIQGGSVRPLTIADARALSRLPGVASAMPNAYGSAIVEFGNRGRRVYVYGATSEVPRVWSMGVTVGEFLPAMDWDRGSPVVVLGPRLSRELFAEANPLGEVVRIGQNRFRVIGVMESKGQMLGFDLDDAAWIPVANAMRLFNRPELDEIDLLAATPADIAPVVERARVVLTDRHTGKEDFTITTQEDSMAMVNRVLGIITGVVTGIAAISLLVGAIGILTIMWIVVQERTEEIGLSMAIGATRGQILGWYLFEAAVTAAAGGLIGLVVGMGGAYLLATFVPGLSTVTPPSVVAAALCMAVVVGLGAGVAPAIRASRMDPVEALRGE